jgi:glycosyltransferase involved in cell wall biosynthesis
VFARCLPLARLRPDVVHFEWHMVAVDYLALFDVWRCPVTTSARGSDLSVYPHVPGLEPYARRLPEVLARAAAVHCVSESLGREAQALGLDPARVRVIRSAVDPAVFHPAARAGSPREDGGALRVVSVGWLRWEKGHEYALQAVREAFDRGIDVRLEIVGRVPEEWEGKSGERERIEHTAADLGIRDRVRLPGYLGSPHVAARLRAGDVLLQASVTEGLPASIVEAMACGLPVVATRCGGIPEAVEHGVHGLLAAPRDPSGLADGLVALAADPGLRRRMGRAGRERVLAAHTVAGEHDAFLGMYREVAGA